MIVLNIFTIERSTYKKGRNIMAIELKLQLGIAEMSFNLNEFLDVIKKLAVEVNEK